jgi:hypothetical protein
MFCEVGTDENLPSIQNAPFFLPVIHDAIGELLSKSNFSKT